MLRELYREVLKTTARAICCVFFFNAKGGRLERSAEGLYRSLLSQLLSRVPGRHSLLASSLEQFRRQRIAEGGEPDGSEFPWDEAEIRKFVGEAINSLPTERFIILIDALDECDSGCSRDVAYFLRDLTDSAYESGVRLDVCFSSRHFPFVSLRDRLEICVEDFNAADITLYVGQKLSMGGLSQQTRSVVVLRDAILAKASGVFLWVVLVVDRLLRDHDEGMNVGHLIVRLNEIPAELGELFTDLLSRNHEDAKTTVRFFQWAILGPPNLRLREWRHVLGFVRCGSFTSLEEWQKSRWYPETNEQLERQIHSISMGLVEVVGGRLTTEALRAGGQAVEDMDSIGAGAGSLVQEGETRTVQVVHESVREFFLRENGFSALDPSLTGNAVGLGHVAIVHNCFDYICLKELDCLVAAREKAIALRQAAENNVSAGFNQELVRPGPSRQRRPPSVASFGSAGSAGYSSPSAHPAEVPNARAEDVAVLDELNKMYKDAEGLEQYRLFLWSRGDDAVAEGSLKSGSTGSSKAPSIVASMVLEADLPLLDYSTTMPIAHARHAEAVGANQEGVTLRLRDGKIWRRWQLLREDIHPVCTLLEYLTEQNLKSWVDGLLPSGFEDDPCEAFLTAVGEDKKEMVATLVRRDVDEPFYPLQEPLLHRLIAGRHLRGALEYLESLGELIRERRFTPSSLSVNIVSPLGHTPLNLATEAADLGLSMRLLQLGADVNASDSFGQRPLDRACSSKRPSSALIKLLIKNHAGVGPPGPNLLTPLQLICMNCEDNGAAIAQVLLLAGAKVNPQGTGGRKPLSISCDKDYPDIRLIHTLISNGASVNAQDGSGQTALHIACSRPEINLDIVNLLLNCGCAAGSRDLRGWCALHIACSKDGPRVAVVWRLVEADRQTIFAADNQGTTPLHIAIRWSNSNVVRTLIENGARVDVADKLGDTPVSMALARLQGHKELGDVVIAKTVVTAAEQRRHTSSELTALRKRLELLGH